MSPRLLPLLLALSAPLAAETILTCAFTEADMAAWKLPPCASVANQVLTISCTGKADGDHTRAVLPFDFTKYAGKAVSISAEFKCEDVSKPAQNWNGVKFMEIFTTADGTRHWMHPSNLWGTHDWKPLSYSCNIPDDVRPGTIELGLQDSTGTVRFRKLTVALHDPIRIFPRLTPKDYQCEYTPRVLQEPVRRGVMSTGNYSDRVIEHDLPDLKAMGGNLYRWQLIRGWGRTNDNQDVNEYLDWVRGKLDGTRKVLDKAQELGIRVVLDLHVAPGGRNTGGYMNMFSQPKFAEAFREAWRILAGAVKGHPALFGYDLINEPHQPALEVPVDYLTLQYEVAQIIRAIDPVTPIIIESNGWDSPAQFPILSPLPLKDIIYQAHMYIPFDFTHQGIHGKARGGDCFYPNPKRPGFNKEALRKFLQPVRDFQLRHNCRIYIGEFSAARWAEGAHNYLKDCIDIFEEYGWDWSYHAFREADCWSVEHVEDPTSHALAPADTLRKKALMQGFSRNRR